MRRLFSVALVALALVVGILKIAEWTCENWWMNSLGYGATQEQFWTWRLEAFVPAFLVWWLVMHTNARLAWHNARWRDVALPLLGPRALAGRNAVSLEDRVRLDTLAHRSEQAFVFLSALLCGVAAANHFDLWVLALNPPDFGKLAPPNADATLLVGVWPAMVWAWDAFGVLLLLNFGLVVSIAAFEGVLDFDTHGMRVGDATARHFAFCGALLLVWIGVRCGLSLLGWQINFGWFPNGVSGFYESTFTNPTRLFFLVSSLPLSLWFSHAIIRRTTPALVVASLWSASAIFLPLIAPSFGRAVWSSSSSLDATLRDEQTHHIQTSRRAWGLNGVELHDLKVASSDFLDTSESSTRSTAPGAALWPQEALHSALNQNDTADRHASELFFARQGDELTAQIIESEPKDTKLSSALALETDPSRAGKVSARRRNFQAITLQSPFFSESNSNFAPSPNSPPSETPPPSVAHAREVQEGDLGVSRSNFLTRLALALRLSDRFLLDANTPVTWHLDPRERVQTLAPFVNWTDAQPHPVWLEGSDDKESSRTLFWLVEGCFTSSSFPGAAMLPSGGDWSGLNYARQTVLGVCNATTGDTQFYLFDPTEPFSKSWNALLPGFFRPVEELPATLRAGTRLSVPLLRAQSFLWTRYHPLHDKLNETLDWAERKDEWRVLSLDSSASDDINDPVILKRNGRSQLALLTAFASYESTLLSTKATGDTTPLHSLLAASDEGEDIWKNAGRPLFTQWLANETISLPLSAQTARDLLNSPYRSDSFVKLAILPSLDRRGDCVGLLIAQGEAQLEQEKKRTAQWTLRARIASTATRFSIVPSPTTTRSNNDLERVRALWNSWKSARLSGRWAKVEELEQELNRILAP